MRLETTEDLALALIAAHDGGPVIETVPTHLAPADMAAVVALQDMIASKILPVGGWKVMAGGTGEPLCAPIPANRYFADGQTINATRHRLVLAELEVAVKLGRDLSADADLATVEASIASLHPVLELVGSPFVNRDNIDFNTKLGDLQSNGAVVVGAAFDEAVKQDLSVLPAGLSIGGTVVMTGAGGASWPAILEAVRWLAGHAASRGHPLGKGQVIITGSRAIAPVEGAGAIQGQFGNWGSVAISLATSVLEDASQR